MIEHNVDPTTCFGTRDEVWKARLLLPPKFYSSQWSLARQCSYRTFKLKTSAALELGSYVLLGIFEDDL